MKPQKNFPEELYLNGQWLKPQNAFVSVFDRAFLFGDAIYEVTPFYQGKPFRLQDHLDRLAFCLGEIKIKFDMSVVEPIMREAITRANLEQEDAAVYIQISRGTAPRTHFFPERINPSFLLYAFPVKLQDFQDKRWKLLISKDLRWHRCDIKSTALLANTMANEEAVALGYDESLLVRDGFFTEGSHSTAFFVKSGVLYTHPEGPLILPGITRKVVLEICQDLRIPFREVAVGLKELQEIDEIFLTGTTTQITSVESIDLGDEEVFRSKGREITLAIQEEFMKRSRGV